MLSRTGVEIGGEVEDNEIVEDGSFNDMNDIPDEGLIKPSNNAKGEAAL